MFRVLDNESQTIHPIQQLLGSALMHSQGNIIETRDLLTPVYNWFTEGFDTADLKEAKALLE